MDEIHIVTMKQRLVGTLCPRCGQPADGGTSLNDTVAPKTPKPGDYGICMYCGSINIYTEALKLRPSRALDRRRMQRDPRLAEFVKLAREVSRRYWQGIQ